ncbi:MAG: DUF6088 family protein [Planctomycetales bacterium]
MTTSLQDILLSQILRQGRGTVFTPKDFLGLGSRDAVDQALSRLVKNGSIQRLRRGLYYCPHTNPRLGISVPPDVDQIADAIARQTGSRIAPSGATAANQFGLSTQVPAKPVYLTDGRSKQVRVGDMVIVIKHVSPRELPIGNRTSTTVLQALRYLGKCGVDDRVLSKIRHALSPKHRLQLLQDTRYTTDWIAEAVRKIAGNDENVVRNG